MATVNRYDTGTIKADAKRTPQGFLRCDATISRTGVQLYRQPDGTTRREYRSPEEVFHPDALASFELAPMTLGHPPVPITAENAKTYMVGSLIGKPEADGKFCRAGAMLTDAKAIEAAESGTAAELSSGYACDLDFTPGRTADGQEYDAAQRNIRGNHVALVSEGRAGHGARLHLDANDAEQVNESTTEPGQPGPSSDAGKETPMALVKTKIDGVECEVSDLAAQLIQKQDTKRAEKKKEREDERAAADKVNTDAIAAKDKALTDAKAEADKQRARADAAEAAKTTAEKARADAEDPKRIDAAVNARVDLVAKARAVLGAEAKLDGKAELAIKREVLAKLAPAQKLDGKSDAYVEAAFDYAVEDFGKKNPAALARAGVIDPPKPGEGKKDEKKDAREEYMDSQVKHASEIGHPKAEA